MAPNATGSFVFHAKADGGLGGVDAGGARARGRPALGGEAGRPGAAGGAARAAGAAHRAAGRRDRGGAAPRGLAAAHRAHDAVGDRQPLRRVVRPPARPAALPLRLHRADDVDDAAAALRLAPRRQRRPDARRAGRRREDGAGRHRAHPVDADAVGRLRLLAGRLASRRRGASAYATHMLLDAQRLRYPVPQERIDDALGWMEQRVSNHYERGGKDHDWHAKTSEPYMHYVLARRRQGAQGAHPAADRAAAGRSRGTRSASSSTCSRRRSTSPATAATSATCGTPTCRRSTATARTTGRSTRTCGCAASCCRCSRICSATIRGRSGWRRWWRRAYRRTARSHYYTTQELVWGITGLGKTLEAGAQDFAPPTLTADGRRLAPQPLPPGIKRSDRTWELPRAGEYERLDGRGAAQGRGQAVADPGERGRARERRRAVRRGGAEARAAVARRGGERARRRGGWRARARCRA